MEIIYGALLLHKAGKEINEANLKKVMEASGGQVDESQIKSLIASLKGIDIDKELESATLVTSAPATAAKEEKKEEPKEEKHEAAAEGLSALFG